MANLPKQIPSASEPGKITNLSGFRKIHSLLHFFQSGKEDVKAENEGLRHSTYKQADIYCLDQMFYNHVCWTGENFRASEKG